jgi:hypothetical protein
MKKIGITQLHKGRWRKSGLPNSIKADEQENRDLTNPRKADEENRDYPTP